MLVDTSYDSPTIELDSCTERMVLGVVKPLLLPLDALVELDEVAPLLLVDVLALEPELDAAPPPVPPPPPPLELALLDELVVLVADG
jgi:hypothetical protein